MQKIKPALPHLISLLVFAIISCLYFIPQFSGKVLPASDTILYKGMSQELRNHNDKTGETALWTNSMFGGMPAYQILAPQKKNALQYVQKIVRLGMSNPAGMFLLGMVCFYILMITLGVRPWLAAIGAICFSFTTNNLVLLSAGHNTKIATLMTSPLIIAGIMQILKKKYWMGFSIFSLGFGMNVMNNHPQMTYYLGMTMGIIVLIALVKTILAKDYKHAILLSVLMIGGIMLGIGSSASRLWTTYEYSKDTMRGKPILEQTGTTASSSSEVDGLEWNYAMSWSNGGIDLLSSFIPYAVGGESGHTLGKKSNTVKFLKKSGYNVGSKMRLPTYWGGLPSTSGPIYFGAIIFFLFILGLFTVEGTLKWGLLGGVLLTFFISMGLNLEWFNRLLFDYLPLFNKFRTPNSVLSVTAILIPILAILGLNNFFSKKKSKADLSRALLISTSIIGIISLIVAFILPSMADVSSPGDVRFLSSIAEQHRSGLEDALMDDRISLTRSSALRTLLLVVLAAGVLFLFLKEKLSVLIATIIIGILAIGDIMITDLNYVSVDSFVNARKYKQQFQPRPVDQQILKDTDLHYRVHDVSISSYVNSSSSYHHKTIGGAHAAKLQRYQDMIDRHIAKGNTSVLNMLNTKYIIIPNQSGGPLVAQRNPASLGNAWFVNKITLVKNANEEIDALTDSDPSSELIVHEEFADYVQGLNLVKEGNINLTEYKPDYLKYQSTTSSDQMAVFSEVWYGPDKGWIAKIDGQEVPFIRANYILRALKVPAGNHVIEFEFKPNAYHTGETISLICSLLILLLLGYSFYRNAITSEEDQ